MEKHIRIYTDGASRGNPGQAAIAFLIIDDDGNIVREYSETIGISTNNEAEYTAIIKALKEALRMRVSEISLTSDSKVVINHLTGKYSVKAENLKILFRNVKELEKHFFHVSYRHARRTDPFITRADSLANRALDE